MGQRKGALRVLMYVGTRDTTFICHLAPPAIRQTSPDWMHIYIYEMSYSKSSKMIQKNDHAIERHVER